jgi:hypothetical protein
MDCKYCNNKATRKGLCQKHYMQEYRSKLPKKEKIIKLCTIDGCNHKHYGKGFCMMHYLRYRRHNDPFTINKPGRKRKFKIKKEEK